MSNPTNDYVTCPACDTTGNQTEITCSVFRCGDCGCLHGSCYKGDSYSYVKPFFAPEGATEAADERARPYDLAVVGSEGVSRRHGWFDPQTGYITQVG